MHFGPGTLLLALSLSPVLHTQAASAQTAKAPARRTAAPAATATPAAATAPATTPAACNCPTPLVQRPVLPYSAKQTTTRVQTLADSTHITTVTTAQIWRDANGRTRNESIRTLADGTQYHSFSINDPVGRIQMSWTVGNPTLAKVMTVYHYPQPVSQPLPAAPQTAQRYYPNRTETLPPQTIEGLYATGNRTTSTIPAGYAGNDRDITTTSEYWFAPSLGIQLRYINDDPRNGKMTTEVTDIQQIAPDPALFQPPVGYQVKETNQ